MEIKLISNRNSTKSIDLILAYIFPTIVVEI